MDPCWSTFAFPQREGSWIHQLQEHPVLFESLTQQRKNINNCLIPALLLFWLLKDTQQHGLWQGPQLLDAGMASSIKWCWHYDLILCKPNDITSTKFLEELLSQMTYSNVIGYLMFIIKELHNFYWASSYSQTIYWVKKWNTAFLF